MYEDEPGEDNFEDLLRSVARELGRSVERALDSVDMDDVADAIGVDRETAGEWFDTAGSWLRANAQNVGDEVTRRVGSPKMTRSGVDPLPSAAPHPMDLAYRRAGPRAGRSRFRTVDDRAGHRGAGGQG